MINLNELSKEEILQIERQLQEYKKTEKFLTGYKVTFAIRFNPEVHTKDSLEDRYSFGDYLADAVANQIEDDLRLKLPEGVSGFVIERLHEYQVKDWFD